MVETQAQTSAAVIERASADANAPQVVSRAELLAMVEETRAFLGEYRQVVEAVSDSEEWKEVALRQVRSHRERFGNGESPEAKLRVVAGLFQFLAARIPQQSFMFRIPTRVGLIPEAENEALNELSEQLRRASRELDNLVADVLRLAQSEATRGDERLQRLLLALAAFLKCLIRRDWNDLALITTHLNLITTSAESHEIVGQIAKIARDIYNSLNEFSQFLGVESLSQSTEELPDAVVNLRSVVTRLEDAANTNLDTLEELNRQGSETREWVRTSRETVSACEAEVAQLQQAHPELAEELDKVRAVLRDEIGAKLEQLEASGESHAQTHMTMIANQSFQDLTGQTLKKVISFLETTQFKLIQLLPTYKHPAPSAPSVQPAEAGGAEEAQNKPIESQDQVDQMLADLGF
jgi:chemotaxis protein CheZ